MLIYNAKAQQRNSSLYLFTRFFVLIKSTLYVTDINIILDIPTIHYFGNKNAEVFAQVQKYPTLKEQP